MAFWKPERGRRASWRLITCTIMNQSPCFEEHLLSSPVDQPLGSTRTPKLLSIEVLGSTLRSVACYSTSLFLWLLCFHHLHPNERNPYRCMGSPNMPWKLSSHEQSWSSLIWEVLSMWWDKLTGARPRLEWRKTLDHSTQHTLPL